MTVMETEDVSDLIRLVPSEEDEETRRSLYHVRAQRAGSHLQVRERALPGIRPYRHPGLRLAAPRDVCLLRQPESLRQRAWEEDAESLQGRGECA